MSCPGPPLTFLDPQEAPVPRDAPAAQTRQPSLPPLLHIPLLTDLTPPCSLGCSLRAPHGHGDSRPPCPGTLSRYSGLSWPQDCAVYPAVSLLVA